MNRRSFFSRFSALALGGALGGYASAGLEALSRPGVAGRTASVRELVPGGLWAAELSSVGGFFRVKCCSNKRAAVLVARDWVWYAKAPRDSGWGNYTTEEGRAA